MGSLHGLLNGIEAVVFDVYGTLAEIGEKRRPYSKALQLLKEAGRTPQDEDATRLMRAPVALRELPRLLGMELPEAVLKPLETDLAAELSSVVLYSDVLPVLNALRQAGIKTGLCSNLAAPYAAPVQNLLPFQLDVYAWSFEIGAIKPEAAIYHAVCTALEKKPHKILFVGDTLLADYIGPRSLGMSSVHLVRNGESQAENTIHSLDELLN